MTDFNILIDDAEQINDNYCNKSKVNNNNNHNDSNVHNTTNINHKNDNNNSIKSDINKNNDNSMGYRDKCHDNVINNHSKENHLSCSLINSTRYQYDFPENEDFKFQTEINNLDKLMHEHRSYLNAKFEEMKTGFAREEANETSAVDTKVGEAIFQYLLGS